MPRYRTDATLDVTVLRSGIPDTLPGRLMNVCERGIAAVIAGELVPGETVGVEVRLLPVGDPLRTRATVRYQDRLRCGLEFMAISAEQRGAIRDWAKQVKAEPEPLPLATLGAEAGEKKEIEGPKGPNGNRPSGKRRKNRRGILWLAAGMVVVIAIAAGVFWWRWDRGWEDLESGQKVSEASPAEKPVAQVPAEVMQTLLVHRVDPVYPADARKANLQGVIAIDVIVGQDGSVLRMRPLNGPDVLARAAMDSVRWWKFEPYRVNGEAAVVETTVAVEFKR